MFKQRCTCLWLMSGFQNANGRTEQSFTISRIMFYAEALDLDTIHERTPRPLDAFHVSN